MNPFSVFIVISIFAVLDHNLGSSNCIWVSIDKIKQFKWSRKWRIDEIKSYAVRGQLFASLILCSVSHVSTLNITYLCEHICQCVDEACYCLPSGQHCPKSDERNTQWLRWPRSPVRLPEMRLCSRLERIVNDFQLAGAPCYSLTRHKIRISRNKNIRITIRITFVSLFGS